MEILLDKLALLMEGNLYLAPIVALFAGVVTAFTPCSLAMIPLVIGYVVGIRGAEDENIHKKTLKYSLMFAVGNGISFVVLGVFTALLSRMFSLQGMWWFIIIGIIMLLMALQIWGVFTIVPSTNLLSKNTKRGMLGAFIAGVLGGVFASPCSTPVIVVLLTIVASKGSVLWGVLLMIFYALGNSFLVIVAGSSIGVIQKVLASKKYKFIERLSKVLLGLLIFIFALYFFSQAYTLFELSNMEM